MNHSVRQFVFFTVFVQHTLSEWINIHVIVGTVLCFCQLQHFGWIDANCHSYMMYMYISYFWIMSLHDIVLCTALSKFVHAWDFAQGPLAPLFSPFPVEDEQIVNSAIDRHYVAPMFSDLCTCMSVIVHASIASHIMYLTAMASLIWHSIKREDWHALHITHHALLVVLIVTHTLIWGV